MERTVEKTAPDNLSSPSTERIWVAHERLALIITNSQYNHSTLSHLTTSTNDGNAIKMFLSKICQFNIVAHLQESTNPEEINAQFVLLGDTIAKNSKNDKKTAVFVYYSGHGLLVDGFTVGCTLDGQEFPLENAVRKLGTRGNSMVISLLDCCRQIPPKETRRVTVMEKTDGQHFIIFAVGPAKSAIYRPDVNGLAEVTKDFLEMMQTTTYSFPSNVLRWAKFHKTVEIVDHTKFAFELVPGVSALPVAAFVKPNIPFEDWDKLTLVEWLARLKLKDYERYKTQILDDDFNGETLKIMMDTNTWLTCNFNLAGRDKIILETAIKNAIQNS